MATIKLSVLKKEISSQHCSCIVSWSSSWKSTSVATRMKAVRPSPAVSSKVSAPPPPPATTVSWEHLYSCKKSSSSSLKSLLSFKVSSGVVVVVVESYIAKTACQLWWLPPSIVTSPASGQHAVSSHLPRERSAPSSAVSLPGYVGRLRHPGLVPHHRPCLQWPVVVCWIIYWDK